jgi:hypothetical protein
MSRTTCHLDNTVVQIGITGDTINGLSVQIADEDDDESQTLLVDHDDGTNTDTDDAETIDPNEIFKDANFQDIISNTLFS